MSEVIVLKLISGEEIIGNSEGRTPSGDYQLNKVRVIQMAQTGPQQMGMALFPYLASAIDESITIYERSLLATPISPPNNLEKAYIQETTSIQIATGNV